MGIFVYCKDCKKVIKADSCKHKKDFNSNPKDMGITINMRNNPWSKQTKIEFSSKTIEQDIKDRNRV
jgi:RNA polymerase subunit RPABC4/transcription elongation factor Spt4